MSSSSAFDHVDWLGGLAPPTNMMRGMAPATNGMRGMAPASNGMGGMTPQTNMMRDMSRPTEEMLDDALAADGLGEIIELECMVPPTNMMSHRPPVIRATNAGNANAQTGNIPTRADPFGPVPTNNPFRKAKDVCLATSDQSSLANEDLQSLWLNQPAGITNLKEL